MNTKSLSTDHGSPCGCGCGGATAGAGTCSCGGQKCDPCHAQGPLVRPHFFAGQLLTEDDLQQLGDYVVAKNRLHNRYLFGAGVVCGLEVTCHPCGDGQVIVHPGYALDCCGNDLTLTCPRTLDINAMVRELRRKLLGADCGDPCSEKHQSPKEVATHQKANGEHDSKNEVAGYYALYIRYCEELTDLVTPYSTGEPCGSQACQHTRIREGVRFELRCPGDEMVSGGLLSRICQCLGDLDPLVIILRDIPQLQMNGDLAIAAVRAIQKKEFPPVDLGELKRATDRLR